jgi:hypothetical protein
MTVFYDAADWRHLPRGEDACFYGDGRFAVTAHEIDLIDPPQYRMITVTGNGHSCSIIDGRPDNNLTDPAVRGFVRERRGLRPSGADAIIYCPRSYVREYQRALADNGHGTLLEYCRLFWWISTLDGRNWTADELTADLAANYDAAISTDRIWAVQNDQIPQIGPGALADKSKLFLPWRP